MAAASLTGWRRLGALLIEEGLLAPEDLVEAFAEQARTGRRLGEIVVDRGLVDTVDLALEPLRGRRRAAPRRRG